MTEPEILSGQEFTPSINFFSEDLDFDLSSPTFLMNWIKVVIEKEGKELRSLNYVFCSDEYLHKINMEYLQHDTFTDIITFPYSLPPKIEGDIFISIPRVQENAKHFEVPFEEELSRVIIHGVLHLCGYKDKTETEQQLMRQKETEAIALQKNN